MYRALLKVDMCTLQIAMLKMHGYSLKDIVSFFFICFYSPCD